MDVGSPNSMAAKRNEWLPKSPGEHVGPFSLPWLKRCGRAATSQTWNTTYEATCHVFRTFPIYGKIKHVPNHQPVLFNYLDSFAWLERETRAHAQSPSPPPTPITTTTTITTIIAPPQEHVTRICSSMQSKTLFCVFSRYSQVATRNCFLWCLQLGTLVQRPNKQIGYRGKGHNKQKSNDYEWMKQNQENSWKNRRNTNQPCTGTENAVGMESN